jgi:hypothetical protein
MALTKMKLYLIRLQEVISCLRRVVWQRISGRTRKPSFEIKLSRADLVLLMVLFVLRVL